MANNRVIGVKKSQFNASQTVPSNATFDYVYQNTNIKVTFADLVSNLGVTGSIVQGGDPDGIPVLDPQGSVNVIRNLVEGFGISIDLTVQEGIEISTDFSFNEDGIALVDDPSASSASFRSLIAGDNVDITEEPGRITIALDPNEVMPDNQRIINDSTDFPDAVGGKIQLEANTEYYIGNNTITIADDFVLADNVVFTGAAGIAAMTYLGNGNFFEAADNNSFVIRGLTISMPNNGTLIESNDTLLGGTLVQIQGSNIVSGLAVANLNNSGFISDGNRFAGIDQGISFSGVSSLVLFARTAFVSSNVAHVSIDLGASTTDNLEILNGIFEAPVGASAISGLASSGNIDVGSLASVGGCSFSGGIAPLSGITEDDTRWAFIANDQIRDTSADALISFSGNATVTTISAVDTPVLVAGTWVEQQVSQFTSDANGRLTYIAERDIPAPITASVDIEPDTGSNITMTVYLALNGTIIPDSGRLIRGDNNDPKSLTVIWQLELSENDYVELFAENNTNTNDLLISGAVLRIR